MLQECEKVLFLLLFVAFLMFFLLRFFFFFSTQVTTNHNIVICCRRRSIGIICRKSYMEANLLHFMWFILGKKVSRSGLGIYLHTKKKKKQKRLKWINEHSMRFVLVGSRNRSVFFFLIAFCVLKLWNEFWKRLDCG